MKVLVTGSGSHLARALLPKLLAEDRITQVIGVDLRPGGLRHAKFSEHRLDIRDPQLTELMHGVDAVIHMAFVVLRSSLGKQRKNRDLIRDINLGGSRHVFELARKAGVKCLIHLSSAAVYGAWPDNPPLMDENQARRVMTGFSYAEDKNAVEDFLDEYATLDSAPRVVRLRPHVILGPHAQRFLLALLRQPFYPRFPEPQPLSQCVWEDDVCDAVLLALFHPTARGAYNLAADDTLAFRDMLRLHQRFTLGLPFVLVKLLHRLLWWISSAGEEPGWLGGMRWSLAVSNHRAREELGWRPRYDCRTCVGLATGRATLEPPKTNDTEIS